MVSTLPSPDRNEKPLVAQPNILLVLAERLKEAPASALVKYGLATRACNEEQDFAAENNRLKKTIFLSKIKGFWE